MKEWEEAGFWLNSHGYKQWPDGCWNVKGEELDPQWVLAEYIKEQHENKKNKS